MFGDTLVFTTGDVTLLSSGWRGQAAANYPIQNSAHDKELCSLMSVVPVEKHYYCLHFLSLPF